MIRRFVYDSKIGAVVELGQHVTRTMTPGDRYADANEGYKSSPGEATGTRIREAALERADRRVFAHKRFGDERRWRE